MGNAMEIHKADHMPAREPQVLSITPMTMIDRALASNATPETLERLLALQERWEANEARKAFDNAMAAAKAEIPVISKNRTVSYEHKDGKDATSYRHEDLGEIARTVDPILAKHGLSYRYQTVSEVISSNVTLGADKPSDPGVAVWFTWDELTVCIPVDRYSKVEANLQAIHHIIEARRVELRHGTLALVRATFTGFTALPPPDQASRKRTWRDVLGIELPGYAIKAETVEAAFRNMAKKAHPDAGGSHAAMSELNAARAEALKEIKG